MIFEIKSVILSIENPKKFYQEKWPSQSELPIFEY